MSEVVETNFHNDRYLVFMLGLSQFGVRLQDVLEILSPPVITPLPFQPDFVKGVMNLRGKIVPIINLKKRFEIVNAGNSDGQTIIVLQQNEVLLGIFADTVEEVIQATDDIQDIEHQQNSHFCLGAICREDKIIQVLDVPMVFSK